MDACRWFGLRRRRAENACCCRKVRYLTVCTSARWTQREAICNARSKVSSTRTVACGDSKGALASAVGCRSRGFPGSALTCREPTGSSQPRPRAIKCAPAGRCTLQSHSRKSVACRPEPAVPAASGALTRRVLRRANSLLQARPSASIGGARGPLQEARWSHRSTSPSCRVDTRFHLEASSSTMRARSGSKPTAAFASLTDVVVSLTRLPAGCAAIFPPPRGSSA